MKIPREVENLYLSIDMYKEDSDSFIATYYDSQVDAYDAFIKSTNYILARNVGEIACSYFETSPVEKCIDIGCGTGEIGNVFYEKLPQVKLDGLDISEDMVKFVDYKFLQITNNENTYKNLFVANAKNVDESLHGEYDALVSAGVFTTMHLGPSDIGKVIAVLKTDGVAIISVRTTAFEDDGYLEVINSLIDSGVIKEFTQTTVPQWDNPNYLETAEILVFKKS